MKLIYLAPVPLSSIAQRPHHFVYWLHQHFQAQVLWIESPPIRYPRWSDFAGLARRFVTGKSGPNRLAQSWVNEPWISHLRLPGIPFEPSAAGRAMNQLMWKQSEAHIARWLKEPAGTLSAAKPDQWLIVGRPCHAALRLHQRFPALPLVYDVMDDMAAFYEGASRAWISHCDDALCKSSRALMVSSTPLWNRYQYKAERCYLVPNGLARNGQALKSKPLESDPQPQIHCKHRGITLGYIGTIAAWFDWSLIDELCDQLKRQGFDRYHIEIIGPIHGRLPKSLPSRVVIKPPLAQEAIWDALNRFDVALIPFKVNRLTASVDPVKFYEYRAAGLPVISSRFGEMARRDQSEGVYFFEDLCRGGLDIESLLEKSHQPEEAYFRDVDWSVRFSAAAGIFAG